MLDSADSGDAAPVPQEDSSSPPNEDASSDSGSEAGEAGEVDSTVPVVDSSVGADTEMVAGDAGAGWGSVPAILSRIVPPTFPNHDCDVTNAKYGGVGDGTTDNTAAFAAAIADCAAAGGGRVLVPAPGTFLTGPIELKSNINLAVATNATVKFLTDPARYLPVVEVSYEGSLLRNYHPLVWAHDAVNIGITGGGTIDGNASTNDWYRFAMFDTPDRMNLRTQNANGVPPAMRIYGAGHYLRPSLIEFMRCTNVLLDGFTAKNSPFWSMHPVMCKNVTAHAITEIASAGNTDGFDPESCVDVHVDGLNIRVGDDPIAIKAGRDRDGHTYYTPTENVVIENCTLDTNNPGRGGGLSIGSEMSAGVRNVYIENIHYTSVGGALSEALDVKASVYRGGFIENVYARNLVVDSIATFFMLTGQYTAGPVPSSPKAFTTFNNVNVDSASVNLLTTSAFWISGADTTVPARGIHISNVTVNQGPAVGQAIHYSDLTMTNVTVGGKAIALPASAP
jgi:polygalacturonase